MLWRKLCCGKTIRAGRLQGIRGLYLGNVINLIPGGLASPVTLLSPYGSMAGGYSSWAAVPGFEMAKTHPRMLRHGCELGNLGTTGLAACLAGGLVVSRVVCASAQAEKALAPGGVAHMNSSGKCNRWCTWQPGCPGAVLGQADHLTVH